MKHRLIGVVLLAAALALGGCAPDGAQGGDEATPTPAAVTPEPAPVTPEPEPTEEHAEHEDSPEPQPTPTEEYEY